MARALLVPIIPARAEKRRRKVEEEEEVKTEEEIVCDNAYTRRAHTDRNMIYVCVRRVRRGAARARHQFSFFLYPLEIHTSPRATTSVNNGPTALDTHEKSAL